VTDGIAKYEPHNVRTIDQGDQIGRMLFYWAIVYFWLHTEVAHILGLLFPRLQLCINCDKKMVGLHYGRLFHNAHLVTLLSIEQKFALPICFHSGRMKKLEAFSISKQKLHVIYIPKNHSKNAMHFFATISKWKQWKQIHMYICTKTCQYLQSQLHASPNGRTD
jgi:hypothetical protein